MTAVRPQRGRLAWPWLRWLLWALATAIALLFAASAWWYPQLPPLDKVTSYQPQQALQVFTSDNVEIAQFGAERREVLSFEQLPALMKEAVVAVEDVRFRQHHGIDPLGVLRALVSNLTGGRRQGASTCWRRPKTEPLMRVVPTQN